MATLGQGDQRRNRIGDVAYDRANGLLYVLELFGDGAKPVVHVWKIGDSVSSFNLNILKAGTGSGTVTSSPSGINCGSTCSAFFNSGTSVTLTATPASGSTFGGWSGACSGSSRTFTVTMDALKSVTATFNTGTTQCTYTINTSPQTFSGSAGTGIVTLTPSESNCIAEWNLTSNSSWLKFTYTCTSAICTSNTASEDSSLCSE